MENVYKDLPIGFHRVNNTPLDDSGIRLSIEDLYDYINNGTAYYGQRLVVEYDDKYSQDIVIRKNSDGKLVPLILNWPNSLEITTKTFNGDRYVLIYYYNGGRLYDNETDYLRIDDCLAWSILPMAGIIAGRDTNIDYLLETYFRGDVQYNIFSQNNICFYDGDIEFVEDSINGILDYSNSNYWMPTSNLLIGLMPRVINTRPTKLWVKDNGYCDMIGVR